MRCSNDLVSAMHRIVIVAVMTVVLVGCAGNSEPPGAPGSLTAHVNGRVEVSTGVSGR